METVSAFKGDIPGGNVKRTWQGKSRFDRREYCVDEPIQAVGWWFCSPVMGRHGAMIDGYFYLLPYGVDARSSADLKASAISADEFHNEVVELTKYGRFLCCTTRVIARLLPPMAQR